MEVSFPRIPQYAHLNKKFTINGEMAARVEMPFAVNAVWQKKESDNSKNKWSEIDVSRPTFWFTLSVPLFFLATLRS